ncbi:MAG TPA: signal peptidase II [Armatimonadetes bacterium]|nr:signal peptidase II [Armatimonadota bacterium]
MRNDQGGTRFALLFLFPFGATILLDQSSKVWALDNLSRLEPMVLISGLLQLRLVENEGIAFGLFSSPVALVLSGGALLMLLVLALTWKEVRGAPLFPVALGLEVGGGASNLLDRLLRGAVVDFIEIPYWPVFNLSDVAVVAGAVMVLWLGLKGPKGG